MSSDRGIDEQNVDYSYSRILFSLKKENFTLATTLMNLEDIILSGRSQKQKDKHCMIPFYEAPGGVKIHRNGEWAGLCQGLEEYG